MSNAATISTRKTKLKGAMAVTDHFAPQPTAAKDLPDPTVVLKNLAHLVIEILAGVRDLEQIGRWLNSSVYQHLQKRVVLAQRARVAKGLQASQPVFAIGSVRISVPYDGVVEGTVMVHGKARSRSVAIRLEGLDKRWQATAINVL